MNTETLDLNTLHAEAVARGITVNAVLAEVAAGTHQPFNPDEFEGDETPAPQPKANGNGKRKGKPVVATTGNGIKVNATNQYKAMVAWTHKAIRVLREADEQHQSKGIHTVFSGFNAAFGDKFNITSKERVWSTIDMMAERGDIEKRPAKRGFMIYLPGEMPERVNGPVDGGAIRAKFGL